MESTNVSVGQGSFKNNDVGDVSEFELMLGLKHFKPPKELARYCEVESNCSVVFIYEYSVTLRIHLLIVIHLRVWWMFAEEQLENATKTSFGRIRKENHLPCDSHIGVFAVEPLRFS